MKSFSLALLTASALAATNYGFQCQEAHVYDKRTSNSINCRLSTKPAQPVQVTLESKDLKFKECLITLKDTAWVNIPVIAPMSCEADAKTKFNITATLSSNCANPQPPLPIEVTRHSSKCIFGSSTGDPHYALTNGVPRVTFHAPSDGSEYDLFMSDQLQVQTRIGTCADGKATCNNAITVRYGSSILVFDLKDKTPGIKTVTKNDGSIVYSPPKVTGKNGDKVDHTFTFPCGSIVKFNTFALNAMSLFALIAQLWGAMQKLTLPNTPWCP